MRKININYDNSLFEFICDTEDTRSGFKHVCNLFINNIHATAATCYYYNRTWESWDYQTVCIAAVNNLMNEYIEQKKDQFKALHNYSRMTKKRANEFTEHLKNCSRYNMLTAVKDNLQYKLH